MKMQPVDSSHIEAVGHDGQHLFVRFKGGDEYRYANVPTDTFNALVSAKSKGAFMKQKIYGKYVHGIKRKEKR